MFNVVYTNTTHVIDGLYTKITGGQRVDLFGAQKADLPDIWQVLVEAGFESGHAYGELPSIYLMHFSSSQSM